MNQRGVQHRHISWHLLRDSDLWARLRNHSVDRAHHGEVPQGLGFSESGLSSFNLCCSYIGLISQYVDRIHQRETSHNVLAFIDLGFVVASSAVLRLV